jgi:hypothetical protein
MLMEQHHGHPKPDELSELREGRGHPRLGPSRDFNVYFDYSKNKKIHRVEIAGINRIVSEA